MARVLISLRLLTPMLGAKYQGRHAPLEFLYEKQSKNLLVDLPHWAWAWSEAFEELDGSIYGGAVRMDRETVCPSVTLYNREFTAQGARQNRVHESFRTGLVISFGASLVRPPPSEAHERDGCLRLPSDSEVVSALTRIGTTMGISPFGSKLGYGRFKIEQLEINGRSCAAPVVREQPGGNAAGAGAEKDPPVRGEKDRQGRGASVADEGLEELP